MKNLLSGYFPPPHAKSDYLFGLLLFAYPILLFTVRGGMNGAFFLIAASALVLLALNRAPGDYRFDRSVVLFGAVTSAGVLVVLASQLYHHDVSGRYFDSNARFLLAAPMLVVLRQVDMRTLSLLQYAFPLGAIAAFLMVMATNHQLAIGVHTSFMNHIHLGDLALMAGMLSILSVNGFGNDTAAAKGVKVAGLCAGIAVSVLSGARGGWVAVPLVVAIALYARDRKKFVPKFLLALLSVGLVILLAYLFVGPIHHRLWMIYSDLANFSAGHEDTSIGIRFQLWRAALHLFAEHPLLGVGANGFGEAMDGLAASGFLTPLAASFGKAEVHSELLAQMVRFGVPGLCFILALYFVPFYMFAREAVSPDRFRKTAAVMGMSVTLGFFVFGLTVETFDLKMTAAFYSLTIAALLAIATNRHTARGAPGQSSGATSGG
ncbi:MAG TPA: O-antigen ligase family protein [Gallionellaceae bacterium]|nr:O-antigen ligase family protein [Gallionellaceae bacterium]